MSIPRNERRQAQERKRYTSYRIGIVARGNDLAGQNDEPEPEVFARPEDATPADVLRTDLQALAEEIKGRLSYLRPMREPQTEDERRARDLLTGQGGNQPYGYAYGSICGLCGGTATGRSHRGFVGVCTCSGAQR